MTFVCISGRAHFLFVDEAIDVAAAMTAAQNWYQQNTSAGQAGETINVVECFVRDRAQCADSVVAGFGTVHTCKWTPQKWIDGLNDERVQEHLAQDGVLLLATDSVEKDYLQAFMKKMADLGQKPQPIIVPAAAPPQVLQAG